MNVHRNFLGFFLGITVLALAQSTYVFIKVVTAAGLGIGYVTAYISLWFYGFDIPSFYGFIHVQGAYPAIITIGVCLTGLYLCKFKRPPA